MKKVDVTGQTFGQLTVIRQAPNQEDGVYWQCRCTCGNMTTVGSGHLRHGHTLSCGCRRATANQKTRTTHGMAGTRLYQIWVNIICRCTNSTAPAFVYYGGRGISICDEWRHDFQAFHDYVSQLPNFGIKGYSLDRIDNDGDYAPDNLRWTTQTGQNRNSRNARYLTYAGETKCMTDWAHETGLGIRTLSQRLTKGWTIERALTQAKRR